MKRMILSQVRALALNVWREAMRDRLVQLLAGSGAALMGFSLVLGHMFVGGEERVLQSTGFWIMGMWGLLAVLYMGSGILKTEIQKKTVYLILSRPVSRPAFLIGKYAGMLMVLLTAFALLAAFWLILLRIKGIAFTPSHRWALVFIFGEWSLLAALSLFFASFTSPLLHNFFLVTVSFLGHWSNDLKVFSENIEGVFGKAIVKSLYVILPNLDALNFREFAMYSEPLDSTLICYGAAVLAAWTLSALVAASLIFSRRRLL